MAMLLSFLAIAAAVVVSLIPPGVGVGAAFGGTRLHTWFVNIALFAFMMVSVGFAIKSRWDGIFIDRDNRISLSRFQLILWILLLVSSLFTAGLTNATHPSAVTGQGALEISVPPEVWALLGLGALTAVAAPVIKDARRSSGGQAQNSTVQNLAANAVKNSQNLTAVPTFDGDVLVKAESKDARWLDIISGDYNGSSFVDASKFQKLAFTVLLFCVYAVDLAELMNESAPVTEFPKVGAGFLALLGISHVAYLADKQLAST